MSGFVAKNIAKKNLDQGLENNYVKDVSFLPFILGSNLTLILCQGPYLESVPATQIDGKPSKKMKKMPIALPPGMSDHDGKVLSKVKRRAYQLDAGWSFLGIRFGWSSVIGIIPL
jgi:hypothetical protein